MFKKTALFAAALIGPASLFGLAATSTPAAAAEVPTAKVYFDDLDLTSQEGQEQLERRLVKAARKMCQMDVSVTGSNLPSPSSRACFRKATQNVDSQIAAATESQGDYVRFGG